MNDKTLRNDRTSNPGHTAFLALSLGMILSGCSTTSETFDCKAGQGVGCKSISQVNKMVNEGSLGSEHEASAHTPLSTPVITTASVFPDGASPSGVTHDAVSPDGVSRDLSGQDIALSDDMVVHRIREEHLRVWVAPFQDHQENLHEGTIVHTVLKPGFWHIKGGE